MAIEIVVPVAPSSRVSRLAGCWVGTSVLALAVAIFLGNVRSARGESDWGFLILYLPGRTISAVLTLLSIAFFTIRRDETGGNREVAVVVYPIGVQIATRTTRNDRSVRPERVRFIPRDQIQDCIVTEHVRATGVTSQVMFRLQSQGSKAGSDPFLVEAFHGSSEMSYVECLTLRAEILRALEATASEVSDSVKSAARSAHEHQEVKATTNSE